MKNVISVDSILDKFHKSKPGDTPTYNLYHDQAKAEFHSLLISKLPEKKPEESTWVGLPTGQHVQDKDTANWYNGYNSAIDDMHQVIDELFRSGDES